MTKRQSPTPGQPVKQPMPIPLKLALFGADTGARLVQERLFVLDTDRSELRFDPMAGEARPDAQLFQLLSDLLQQVTHAHASFRRLDPLSIPRRRLCPAPGRRGPPAVFPICSVKFPGSGLEGRVELC